MSKLFKQPVWGYIIAVFGWSGLFYLPSFLVPSSFLTTLMRYLAGAGPLVMGIGWTYAMQSKTELRRYWLQATTFNKTRLQWYALSVIIVPVLTFIAVVIDRISGGDGGIFRSFSTVGGFLTFLVIMLVFGPLPEELGWRGYALPQLIKQLTPLSASILLGSVWAIWHLPLFFIPGTYQAGLGVGSSLFWLFLVSLLFDSIVITWIFINTNSNTLTAIVYHFMTNVVGELFYLSPSARFYRILVYTIVCVIIATQLVKPHQSKSQ